MAPSHVEPIASYRSRCLSPLFCTAWRRLDSRAVEAAVSASLPFSLSTSLSTHSAGLETLFSFEQRSLGNIHRWLRIVGLYLFRSVLVGSLRPSVYTIEGGLRTTGCRCYHGYLDFFPKMPEHVVVGIPMQYSRKSSMGNWRSCNFHTLSTATLSTELRRYSKPSTSSPQRSCPGYVAVLRRLCSFTDQVLTQLDVLTNLLRSISCRNGAMRK